MWEANKSTIRKVAIKTENREHYPFFVSQKLELFQLTLNEEQSFDIFCYEPRYPRYLQVKRGARDPFWGA